MRKSLVVLLLAGGVMAARSAGAALVFTLPQNDFTVNPGETFTLKVDLGLTASPPETYTFDGYVLSFTPAPANPVDILETPGADYALLIGPTFGPDPVSLTDLRFLDFTIDPGAAPGDYVVTAGLTSAPPTGGPSITAASSPFTVHVNAAPPSGVPEPGALAFLMGSLGAPLLVWRRTRRA